MPTTGPGKFPYPNSTTVPDVPADLLLLAQRTALMTGAGVGYVADATALAATITNGDAFTGWIVYQVAADAYVRYNGSAFKLYGTKTFASAAAQTTWNASFGGLLEVGSLSFRNDVQITDRWNGSAWKAWDSDWLAYAGSVLSLVLGTGGTQLVRWKYTAGKVLLEARFSFGTGGTYANPAIPLPVAADPSSTPVWAKLGDGTVSTSGTFWPLGLHFVDNTNGARFYLLSNTSPVGFLSVSGSIPIAPASGVFLFGKLEYTPA